jgi:FkbM family methyltransferase
MLIDLNILINLYNLKIKGILHIGAHTCEELEIYRNNNINDNNIIWIEGNPKLYNDLINRGIRNVYNVLVSDTEEMVDFIITSNDGASSSILELDDHLKEYPNVIEVERIKLKTEKLDNFFKRNNINISYNFINIDIQGAELKALKGIDLSNVDYIFSEVNIKHLYKNCVLINELDEYLKQFRFRRVETVITRFGWGDALYIKI